MFSCSKPFDDMIALMKEVKARFNLKIIAISNEGKEINQYRIETFGLNHFIDCFVSSCFVQLRKPDVEMYQLAINIAQTYLNQCIYIDNRPILVGVAQKLSLSGIVHVNYINTKKALEQLLVEII